MNRLKFTRRERRGSILLLLLVVGVILLPKFLKQHAEPLIFEFTEEEQVIRAGFEKKKYERKSKKKYQSYTQSDSRKSTLPKDSFDPDTMSVTSWQSLGLSERQCEVLVSYKNRIGGFTNIEQLYDAYVLDSARVKQWEPFLVFNKKKPIERKIEINSANHEEFKTLYGIGDKLSERIITYREKLGGFVSVQQISEVYGLKPETFDNIRAKLSVDPSKVKQIYINQMDVKALAAHPYISFNLAKLIVNYRDQHGPYAKSEDLLKSHGILFEDVQKIEPYINFAP